MNGPPDLQIIPPDLETPPPPHMSFEAVEREENAIALAVNGFLVELHDASHTFTSVLLLREYCQRPLANVHMPGELLFRSLWPKWDEIAAKHAVLSARNYWMSLKEVGSWAGRIKGWKTMIDFEAIRVARKAFTKRFPDVVHVRDAISHPDLFPNPNRAMNPGRETGDGWTVFPRQMISDRQFWHMWEGKMVSCDIDWAAARFIRENAGSVFQAFSAVSHRPA